MTVYCKLSRVKMDVILFLGDEKIKRCDKHTSIHVEWSCDITFI